MIVIAAYYYGRNARTRELRKRIADYPLRIARWRH